MCAARTFFIRTYGCQMNVHDSDKLANLLHHEGLDRSETDEHADILVINTCSIRDKAENQLYSDLGVLKEWKAARHGRLLGVGGCVAQQVGDRILSRFPQVDFVFGTHNLKWVPAMMDSALQGRRRSETEAIKSVERFDLPQPHAAFESSTPGRAFLTVMEGCDMFCSFCIVPTTRGREISRPAESILHEAQKLAENGIREITLLGQTVNAYGRHDLGRGKTEQAGTMAFSELLTQLDAIPGLERIRYTSPHPLFYDPALIAAHGELRALCPHVHLPVQSGSDSILSAMRRRYGRDQYLEIIRGLREAVPSIAITTDLIVGFPGETEQDFEDTLELMAESKFVDSYSFKYSPRPGTQAIKLPDPVPPEVAQNRLERLQDLQRNLTLAHHRSRVGQRVEVLVDGTSRKGRNELRGRDRHHRLVNLRTGNRTSDSAPQKGELVQVDVIEATPHSLIGEISEAETGLEVVSRSA
ncbi:MAG: tRNA (N6-isopentenyl adenosine(37)-C2)-methylthiotransferase MiaB [Myxococcota bacterium]